MRIAFDSEIFRIQAYGGISRYFVSLAEELAGLRQEVRIFAPLHRNRYLGALPRELVYGRGPVELPRGTGPLVRAANRMLTARALRSWGPDLVHETYFSSVSPELPGRPAIVVTVYDMIHELFAHEFPADDATTRHKRAAVARADHVICISESTRRDLLARFEVEPEKVSVVHLGFEGFRGRPAPSIAAQGGGRPYLLFVGDRQRYKNFPAMVEAVAANSALRDQFSIVAFGGGPFTEAETGLIDRLGFDAGQIRQLSGDDTVLASCYAGAAALVYPSRYEGFGLPPLEAMALDCPVVCSNTSSLPEVVGDAGEFFDPSCVDSIGDAIERVVGSPGRRADLVAAGRARLDRFQWADCAAATLAVYDKLLGTR